MEHRNEMEIRKARFFEKRIGNRTALQLANELYSIYMTLRGNMPHDEREEENDDPESEVWEPADLCLADVIDKRICRGLHNEINELCELAGMRRFNTGWKIWPNVADKSVVLGPFETFDEAKEALAKYRQKPLPELLKK